MFRLYIPENIPEYARKSRGEIYVRRLIWRHCLRARKQFVPRSLLPFCDIIAGFCTSGRSFFAGFLRPVVRNSRGRILPYGPQSGVRVRSHVGPFFTLYHTAHLFCAVPLCRKDRILAFTLVHRSCLHFYVSSRGIGSERRKW